MPDRGFVLPGPALRSLPCALWPRPFGSGALSGGERKFANRFAIARADLSVLACVCRETDSRRLSKKEGAQAPDP